MHSHIQYYSYTHVNNVTHIDIHSYNYTNLLNKCFAPATDGFRRLYQAGKRRRLYRAKDDRTDNARLNDHDPL